MCAASTSTIAMLLYSKHPTLNFAHIVGELDTALEACQADRRNLSWDCDDVAIFDLDGSRVALGWAEELEGDYPCCLSISVGTGPSATGARHLAERRDALAQVITSRIQLKYPPSMLLWHRVSAVVEPDLLDSLLLEAVATVPAEGTETQPDGIIAETPVTDHDPIEAIAATPQVPDVEFTLADIAACDILREGMETPTAVSLDLTDDDKSSGLVSLDLRADEMDAPMFATSPPIPRIKVRPMLRHKSAATPANVSRYVKPRQHYQVQGSTLDRLLDRLDKELPQITVPAGKGDKAEKTASPESKTLPPMPVANVVADPPAPILSEMDRIRTALYPPETEGNPRGRDQSPQIRLAVYAVNGSLIMVSPPVGAALLVYNFLGGEDLRATARAMAITGTLFGLTSVGIAQQMLAIL